MAEIPAQKRGRERPAKEKSGKGSRGGRPKSGHERTVAYTKLDGLVRQEVDRVNLYGVVLGSSNAFYHEDSHRFILTLKLIDETVNPARSPKGEPAFLSVTIKSNSKDDLPTITKLGDVVRIHRGRTVKQGTSHVLDCPVNYMTAWALFDGAEGVAATQHTGKTYTFTEEDKQRLREIREFAQKFFRENCFETMVGVEETDKTREKYVVCQVVAKKRKGEEVKKTVCHDGNDFVKFACEVKEAEPGDVVYMRVAHTFLQHYMLNDYASVLRVPKEYKSAVELAKRIEEAKKVEIVRKKFEEYATPATPKPAVILPVTAA